MKRSVQITEFISELALLLESGMSCRDALKIVQQEQDNRAMQKLIAAILKDVEKGMSLADSFAQYPDYFEPFLVESLVTGGKDEVNQMAGLLKIAQYHEFMDVDAQNLTKKIAFSSIYLLFLFFLLFVLTTILLIYVVPVFADMFSSFGGNLPGLTLLVLNISDFFVANGLLIIGAVFVLIGLLWKKWQVVTLYIPLIGRLYHKIALIRVLRTCVFMLSEGASVAKAFAAAAQMVNNPIYAKRLLLVSEEVAGGMPLSDALQVHSIFPKKMLHAVIVATQLNQLDKFFTKLADFYAKQLQLITEPTIRSYTFLLIILIGLIAGLLILSMYLPIFTMGAAI